MFPFYFFHSSMPVVNLIWSMTIYFDMCSWTIGIVEWIFKNLKLDGLQLKMHMSPKKTNEIKSLFLTVPMLFLVSSIQSSRVYNRVYNRGHFQYTIDYDLENVRDSLRPVWVMSVNWSWFYFSVFNFHHTKSFTDYLIGVRQPGKYRLVLDSDRTEFDGHSRLEPSQEYFSKEQSQDQCDHSTSRYIANTWLHFL